MIFWFQLLSLVSAHSQHFCGVQPEPVVNPYYKKNEDFETAIPHHVLDRVVEIPVVVHWVDGQVPDGPQLEHVKNKVQTQVDALNRDFNSKIKFCLADLDPSDQPMQYAGLDIVTYPIHEYGGLNYIPGADIEEDLKPKTIWNRNQYLNIWVVPGIDTSLFGMKLGYANFPVNSQLDGLNPNGAWTIDQEYFSTEQNDGVVIHSGVFGNEDEFDIHGLNLFSGYEFGKVTTHEVGHWLGLFHTFQGTELSNACSLQDHEGDYCIDTPKTASPTGGCPTNHPQQCGQVTQIENYMDYTNDYCKNRFTEKQTLRMKTTLALADGRRNLHFSNKCKGTKGGLMADHPYQAFPNPTSGIFQIRVQDPNLRKVRVVDTAGKLIQEILIDGIATYFTLDVTNASAGMFILEYVRADGSVRKQKILKF